MTANGQGTAVAGQAAARFDRIVPTTSFAAKEAAEIAHIEVYLPQAATAEEIAAAVDAAIAETGAASMKDMGLVMKATLGSRGRSAKQDASSAKRSRQNSPSICGGKGRLYSQ